jgi:hypothetical protein
MKLSERLRRLDPRARWAADAPYWKTVPARLKAILLGGIFCLFAAFSLVLMMIHATEQTIPAALTLALNTGCLAVGLAYAGLNNNFKMIVAFVAVEVIFLVIFNAVVTTAPLSASAQGFVALHRRLLIEGSLSIALIILGYALLIGFIRKEGLRVFGSITEINLATEVHRALAPLISRRIGSFEVYGASVPSGEMGGDLVDVVESRSRWIAYVADVCGHGVPAGMIMAMVKSAARMGAANEDDLSVFLADVNRVLASTTAPNSFVTFACLSGSDGGRLEFALAGHLPILHYSKRLHAVEERSVENLPLAVLPQAQFASSTLDCEPGDLLAVITDGLTEVSDAQGRELGLKPFEEVLLESADAPLSELMTRVRECARKYGKQIDDQSLLLLRRLA